MAAEKGYEHIAEAKIVDPIHDPKMPEYANLLFELRKAKGMTEEEAAKKAQDPLYLGCLMIKAGDADGELAGARGTTADTIRPAFQILKTKPRLHDLTSLRVAHDDIGYNGASGKRVRDGKGHSRLRIECYRYRVLIIAMVKIEGVGGEITGLGGCDPVSARR